MRLLSVIHGPAYGGAHNQFVRLAPELVNRGVESIAVVPTEAAEAAARIRREGGESVEVVELPLSRLRASTSPRDQLRFLRFLRPDLAALAKLIAEREVDVVQVHGVSNPQGAVAARRTDGTGVVTQLLDTRSPMPLRRALMPLTLRVSDEITCWGLELARTHPGAERLGERLTIVYPPLDPATFSPDAAARDRARRQLGVEREDAPLIGTVGVLNPQKGHDLLIEAIALMARGRPDLRGRILGSESPGHAAHAQALRQRADELGLSHESRLELVDPGDEVPAMLNALDVFVMSSVPRSEGMPTAILEAMATGKPVVSTRVGAVAELVEDGVTGFLVEPGDAAAIATAVRRLLDDPELRQTLGEAGRRRALEQFDLSALADLHAGAYERASARARARSGREPISPAAGAGS